jgi:hypothetical protein
MTENNPKLFWKDKYYFPTLVDIILSNICLLIAGILLMAFFYNVGSRVFLSLVRPPPSVISLAIALLLLCFLSLLLVLTIWIVIITIRTFSYFLLSKHFSIQEGGIFLGEEKTFFKRFDSLLNKPLERISFLKKIFFFRATLDYFFFKITNPSPVYLNFNEIRSISISKEKVFRSILRKWWSPADEVYYINIVDNNGFHYKKEIKNIYSFMKNDCLNFLKQRIPSEIKIPFELQSKNLKIENIINIISAWILLAIIIFFFFVYLEYYWGLNFGLIDLFRK